MNENVNQADENKKDKFLLLGALVIALIGLAVFVGRSFSVSKFEEGYSSNKDRIHALTSQINGLVSEDDLSTEDIQETLYSASNVGTKVAELQNKYMSLDSSNGSEDTKLNAIEIESYLGEKDTSKRVPWYRGSFKLDENGNQIFIKPEWTFETTYHFSGKTTPALWICRDVNSSNILAYCIGTYNANTSKFENVEFAMTSIGSDYVAVTNTPAPY